MTPRRMLIANRGEIAIRILRAARELEIETVAVHTQDDALALHVFKADRAFALPGTGTPGYLDIAAVIAAAKETGCDAIHPGYGFLSENADFARACADVGILFVGPAEETLQLFGSKVKARELAERLGVPVLAGTQRSTSLDEARAFLREHGSMMIKAVAGGGGRGMRPVTSEDQLEEAFVRCQSEAKGAFGIPDVYVEQLIPRARHIEVQVLGDCEGNVTHLWERECSIQRRNQKVVEIAPSPNLDAELRAKILSSALEMARACRYQTLGTFEFLVDATANGANSFAFIEANPRLQVEHTVTEEVTGVDLVQAQIQLASGTTLEELNLTGETAAPRGFAIQLRINLETLGSDGVPRPAQGTITAFEAPSGVGVRTESAGYSGYTTSTSFDPLIAKLVVADKSPDYRSLLRRAYRALSEFRIEGVGTNVPLLLSLLRHPDVQSNDVYTRFLEDHGAALLTNQEHARLYFQSYEADRSRAGAVVDSRDPLAVLAHGQRPMPSIEELQRWEPEAAITVADGTIAAPMQGTVISVEVEPGQVVMAGQQLFVMEAMKMEHIISAPSGGTVLTIDVAVGEAVYEGTRLASIQADASVGEVERDDERTDLDLIRPDLAAVNDRHRRTRDEARSDAVVRRRKTGQRTTRENIADLCDDGTFTEYGSLVVAGRRALHTMEELIDISPADGLVTGVGCVNGELFGPERSRCVVMSYDYTVFAGTQGAQNHRKHDRMFHTAERARLPLIFFTEGGGGRPGDTDGQGEAGLKNPTFHLLAKLNGVVPMIGINSGRCFAGNAAVLGFCDVVIATRNSSIGMGGPAMVEGGGLGVFRPEEIGPMSVQVPNGVVDIPVEDEVEAVAVARKYLSYFQGRLPEWEAADQRLLRSVIPENRLRVYDVRRVIELIADTDSVLELRRYFGLGMVTALIRIEGRPVGVIANNPTHLAGAIDADGADKASRFMQLCDAFGIPIVTLIDTPGIMVGPESEKTALVRHSARVFVNAAGLQVPMLSIVLRKSYGLGAMAMAGGGFKVPFFVAAWPTGEFGGMGLEGQVKLGFRKDLLAIEDIEKRRARYDELVAAAYERGKALNSATNFEIDDVIDPADTRSIIAAELDALASEIHPRPTHRTIDTW